EAAVTADAADRDPLRGARARLVRAGQALVVGNLADEIVHRLGAAEVFERVGNQRAACEQRIAAGGNYLATGANELAERVLRTEIEVAERLALVAMRANARYELGLAVARRGARDEARTLVEQAVGGFVRSGCVRMEALARARLAWLLATEGDLSAAEREARAGEQAL